MFDMSIFQKNTGKKLSTLDMALIAIMAAIMAVCAWVTVPLPVGVPFTMQTFGLFFALCMLGGNRGTLAVVVYILLGMAGAPVFSGFQGGIGVLSGMTGGYITGFILSGIAYIIVTGIFGEKTVPTVAALVLGMVLYYTFGTAWFMVAYAKNVGSIRLYAALAKCVFPFIIPDLVKMVLAFTLAKRVKKFIKA